MFAKKLTRNLRVVKRLLIVIFLMKIYMHTLYYNKMWIFQYTTIIIDFYLKKKSQMTNYLNDLKLRQIILSYFLILRRMPLNLCKQMSSLFKKIINCYFLKFVFFRHFFLFFYRKIILILIKHF